jgi:hypothetical protein
VIAFERNGKNSIYASDGGAERPPLTQAARAVEIVDAV